MIVSAALIALRGGILNALKQPGLGLSLVILLVLALFAVLGGVRYLLKLVPMSKARRAALRRIRPVIDLALVLAYVLIAVPIAFSADSRYPLLVLALLSLGGIAMFWPALRDLVNGIFIKSAGLARLGDRVELAGHAGVVKRLGQRTLTLETDDGAEIFIPYAQLSKTSIIRAPRAEGVHCHTFKIPAPPGLDPLAASELVRRLALMAHWSSLVRDPEIEIASEGLRVSVYALGHSHGPVIEAELRAELKRAAHEPDGDSAKTKTFSPPLSGT